MASTKTLSPDQETHTAFHDLWNRLVLQHPEVGRFTYFGDWTEWQRNHPEFPPNLWEFRNEPAAELPKKNEEEERRDDKERQDHSQAAHPPLNPPKEKGQQWQGLLNKYPEIASFATQDEFDRWKNQLSPKERQAIPDDCWSDKKYYEATYWKQLVKKNPRLSEIVKQQNPATADKALSAWVGSLAEPEQNLLPQNLTSYWKSALLVAREEDEIQSREKDKSDRINILSALFPFLVPPPQEDAEEEYVQPFPEEFYSDDFQDTQADSMPEAPDESENQQSNLDLDTINKITDRFGTEETGAEMGAEAGAEAAAEAGTEVAAETGTAMGAEAGATGVTEAVGGAALETGATLSAEAGTAALGAETGAAMGAATTGAAASTAAGGTAVAGAGGAGLAAGAGAAAALAPEAAAGGAAVAAAGTPVWIIVAIAAGIALLIIIIVVVIMAVTGQSNTADSALLKITMTGPKNVENPTDASQPDLAYTINVTYPGAAQDVIVTDPLPQGTTFVSATEPFTLQKDTNGAITAVQWSLANINNPSPSITEAAQASFDLQKFTSYGFPPPSSPNPITLSGNDLTKWKQEMLPEASKVASLTGVDIGILGMWPFIEGTHYDQFYDNCNDGKNGEDYNPNTPCLFDNWQVGYGVRPMEQISLLQDAITNMHPGETVQQIGQAVLDQAKAAGAPLTYPDNGTFPDVSIGDIITGAQNGNGPMRARLGTLMMDRGIGTYILGRSFQGSLGPNLASTMEGWDSHGYYDKQKVINYIKAIYDAGVSTSATGGQNFNATLTITLHPLPGTVDTTIVNQATAEIVGAQESPGNGTTTSQSNVNTQTTTSIPPNTDTCGGTYKINLNPLNKNFGDPSCTFTKDQLFTALKLQDPAHAYDWFLNIVPCESGYDPNSFFNGSPDTAGAWGLFQMGRGLNGPLDHGDVNWSEQISNAISYNKKINQSFRYWECAKYLWTSNAS